MIPTSVQEAQDMTYPGDIVDFVSRRHSGLRAQAVPQEALIGSLLEGRFL